MEAEPAQELGGLMDTRECSGDAGARGGHHSIDSVPENTFLPQVGARVEDLSWLYHTG